MIPIKVLLFALLTVSVLLTGTSSAQQKEPDESLLGTLVVTGDAKEQLLRVAVLPSFSPVFEDVIVRGVVRRDFEISGLFDLLSDDKAPLGSYGFDDPIDLKAWQSVGAEVIVKVAAKNFGKDKLKVFGLCYFLKYGKDPVYYKTFVVNRDDVRITAHRITDALIGAITGKDGAFASHLTFAGKWGRNHVAFTVDSDGHGIKARTNVQDTAVSPTFGPSGELIYSRSRNYSPFRLVDQSTDQVIDVPFKTSVYSSAYSVDKKRLAVAVAESGGSGIYVGNADGTGMKKVSKNELATHPVFSPSGKLAWIGGGGTQGTQRVYVDGKAVSPPGFTAAAPTFCKTEYGIVLIFAVSIGNDRQDLILTNEMGGNPQRLTQHQGSNSYPACSPDGRMLAYFHHQGDDKGLYIKSLKSFRTQRISTRYAQSLRWDRLPEVQKSRPIEAAPAPTAAPAPAPESAPAPAPAQ